MLFTYFKIVPHSFASTIFDTADLSTVRGSSLTLLAMPDLLFSNLAINFPKFTFELLQASASELFFRVGVLKEAKPVTIEKITGKAPDGVKPNVWQKALVGQAKLLRGSVSDEGLLESAQVIKSNHPNIQLTAQEIAGLILAKCGNVANSEIPISETDIGEICEAIDAFLSGTQSGYPLDLFLFNTSILTPKATSAKPKSVMPEIETKLGIMQMNSLSCVPQPPSQDNKARADLVVCPLTGIYPTGSGFAKERRVSDSAFRRREVGRSEKNTFANRILVDRKPLLKELGVSGPLIDDALEKIKSARSVVMDFASDFGELVEDPPSLQSKSVASKLCVLHADGNSFGKVRLALKDFSEYRQFSIYLDTLKAGLLADIIIWISESEEMRFNGVARFETLLWGGDEFTFVVPAWCGWEFMRVFHENTSKWTTLSGAPLTFSTGLVFGPYKAPIRDLKNAAEQLAEQAKDDRSQAQCQVLAYESIDRVHFNPTQFRRAWVGDHLANESAEFSIATAEAIAWPKRFSELLGAVSRTALHRLYSDYSDQLDSQSFDEAGALSRIDRIAPELPQGQLEKIKTELFDGKTFPLLKLAQVNLLMDYVLPKKALQS